MSTMLPLRRKESSHSNGRLESRSIRAPRMFVAAVCSVAIALACTGIWLQICWAEQNGIYSSRQLIYADSWDCIESQSTQSIDQSGLSSLTRSQLGVFSRAGVGIVWIGHSVVWPSTTQVEYHVLYVENIDEATARKYALQRATNNLNAKSRMECELICGDSGSGKRKKVGVVSVRSHVYAIGMVSNVVRLFAMSVIIISLCKLWIFIAASGRWNRLRHQICPDCKYSLSKDLVCTECGIEWLCVPETLSGTPNGLTPPSGTDDASLPPSTPR